MDLAVDLLGHDLRLADGEFESLTAHLLDEDGQSQLTAALDLPGVGAFGRDDLEGDVADELLVEAVLDHARGDLRVLLTAGQRGGVDAHRHRDRRIVDDDRRHRLRVVDVGERVTDHDVGDAGDGDDVTGRGLRGGHSVEALGLEQLGDLHRADLVSASPSNLLAFLQSAAEDAQQRQTAEER